MYVRCLLMVGRWYMCCLLVAARDCGGVEALLWMLKMAILARVLTRVSVAFTLYEPGKALLVLFTAEMALSHMWCVSALFVKPPLCYVSAPLRIMAAHLKGQRQCRVGRTPSRAAHRSSSRALTTHQESSRAATVEVPVTTTRGGDATAHACACHAHCACDQPQMEPAHVEDVVAKEACDDGNHTSHQHNCNGHPEVTLYAARAYNCSCDFLSTAPHSM